MEVPVKIEKLGKHDLEGFMELIKLFEDVFEMKAFSMPTSKHLRKVLSADNFSVFVAITNGRIVGGLTCYVLEQYYSEQKLAYIYDLAIRREFQRQGIGRKLIAACKDFYLSQGFEEVFVQADKVDDYALDFYRSTNPSTEEEVVHYTYRKE